ncbi:MAG TPA: hydroxymethylglutaryl-CoA lyase [Rhodothermales bacterium]|nr:hydroxymethylglutaryl-CoA lyase [Rhodothermales bacterium]
MSLPSSATICEVGLRDGLQHEDRLPTDFKLELIGRLIDAGLKEIQVASFVHPKWVPQMADAEAICAGLERRDDVVYTALALNMKGLERAHAAGVNVVDLSISASDAHSIRNANMPLDEAERQMIAMIDRCQGLGIEPRAGLQCVFGCANNEPVPLDRVVRMAARIAEAGAESVSLADSTGVANPVQVRNVVQAVSAAIGDTPIVLHLHNTRGVGLANVVAGLESGVTRFDAAVGGMGGCPFIPGATGNIPTEDTVYLLESMGVETGIDLHKVSAVAGLIEELLGKAFPGLIHRLVLDRGEEAVETLNEKR